MKIVHLIQGSPEWHAHRATHWNASDAPAMMGCSPYQTRDELIQRLATGIAPEADAETQRRFDDGHRFEALARPMAEAIVGDELYPVTGVLEGTRLSASFDGLTLLADVAFEHKSLNKTLREHFDRHEDDGSQLPLHYRVQMEQQLMVSGADKVLFVASDWDGERLVDERHCWYYPTPELRAQIVAGWEQLERDVAAWTPTEAKPAPVVGKTPDNLPALLIQVSGAVTASNLPEFKAHALEVFKGINRTLATDQDFADAEKTVKWCADVESRLAAAKEHALSQTASIDALFKMIDDISAEARRTRLELDKLVKARKEELRSEIVAGGIAALKKHIASLNAAMPADYMPTIPADFAGVIKGKRTIDSLQGAVNDELARAKIAANEVANRIHANVKTLQASGLVVHDAATLVLKAPDDLAAIIANRLAAEQQRQEAERERIRAEEQAKAQREAEAKAAQQERERIAREAEHARAELAQAVQDQTLTTPVAQDLGELVQAQATASIHTHEVIHSAQRAAAAGPAVIPLRPATPESSGMPTLKLGQIAERLGFTLQAEFLRGLGFEPAATDRASKLYHEADFPLICAALVRHIERVQAKAAA